MSGSIPTCCAWTGIRLAASRYSILHACTSAAVTQGLVRLFRWFATRMSMRGDDRALVSSLQGVWRGARYCAKFKIRDSMVAEKANMTAQGTHQSYSCHS